MKTIITTAMMILITVTVAFSQGVSGMYYGTSNGAAIECKIVQSGSKLSGVLKDDASTYVINGTYNNGYTQGKVIADGYYQMSYTGSFSGLSFKASVTMPNGSKLNIYLSKNKPAANNNSYASNAPAGNLDKNVMGRWMHESVMSTTGYGDNISMVSVTYYRFNANGTFYEGSNAAGGGANWSYSGKGSDIWGKWYTKNGVLYTVEDGTTYTRTYFMNNGNLVFKHKDGSYTILER